VDAAVKHWSEKPEWASKLSTFSLFLEVSGAVGTADPTATSFAARRGRLWCTALIAWPDNDDGQRKASKAWCNSLVAALDRFRVTTYLNNAMPEGETDMLGVFPPDTMRRLRALKQRHDPDNLLKMGAWEYEAHA
jgi:hypothetical protein